MQSASSVCPYKVEWSGAGHCNAEWSDARQCSAVKSGARPCSAKRTSEGNAMQSRAKQCNRAIQSSVDLYRARNQLVGSTFTEASSSSFGTDVTRSDSTSSLAIEGGTVGMTIKSRGGQTPSFHANEDCELEYKMFSQTP